MNKTVIAVVALIIAAGAMIIVNKKPDSAAQGQLNYSMVQTDIQGGAIFYDVRTPEEYAASHFGDTQNLPLQAIQAGRLPAVEKDAKIYVHCQSGNRSAQAAQLLRAAGYTNVVDLGGLADVRAIGGQLTT